MERHHRTADQLTQKERNQRPEHVAAEDHGERPGYDRSDLQIRCDPQGELTREPAVPLRIGHIVDRADLDRRGRRLSYHTPPRATVIASPFTPPAASLHRNVITCATSRASSTPFCGQMPARSPH